MELMGTDQIQNASATLLVFPIKACSVIYCGVLEPNLFLGRVLSNQAISSKSF
jgi:hypothetical protein